MIEQPWRAADLAAGYHLTAPERGYRTLRRVGGGPLAVVPDQNPSLLALVPLSHYLGCSIRDLKQSFLSPSGSPLMRQRLHLSEQLLPLGHRERTEHTDRGEGAVIGVEL